jgi:hypothetical protein
MFSAESARLIGLDNVRTRWPHLTGRGVTILQVEWDMTRTDHTDAVRAVIAEIAPGATIRLMSEKEFFTTLSNPKWYTFFGIPTWNPKPAEWDVECHAYTGSRGSTDVDTCRAQDLRLARDAVAAFAASGNGLADIKGEWHRSLKTMMCGTPTSPSGIFNMGTLYGSQPYPDLTVPTQWTSIAAPAMAAAWALVIEACHIAGDLPPDGFYIENGVPRVDLTIDPDLTEAEPAPPETWEQRRVLVSTLPGNWTPIIVEQSREVLNTWRVYELSSLGNVRNDHIEHTQDTETRLAAVQS